MPDIIILNSENKVVRYSCHGGENLYQLLMKKQEIASPCGGKGICGKCVIQVKKGYLPVLEAEREHFSAARISQGFRLACLHEVKDNLSLFVLQKNGVTPIVSTGYVRDVKFTPAGPKRYGLAVDLGTTTVVVSLVELSSGKELGSLGCLNGQRAYGQDVISRIHWSMTEKNGRAMLQEAVWQNLRQLIDGLLLEYGEAHGVSEKNICSIAVAGNNTMIHLLTGKDPSRMGRAPYAPAFTGALNVTAGDLGLPIEKDCPVYCLPAVSAFVGGDITAGILACGLAQNRKKDKSHGHGENILFVDIGTNGEMVLSAGGRLLACSCAAGPALEGMNISCGLSASVGAISGVRIEGDGQERKAVLSLIGEGPPVGICGSGLLDGVAELRRCGLLDGEGRLQPDYSQKDLPDNLPENLSENRAVRMASLIEDVEGQRRVVLSREWGIYLTQQDIRQVQLVKASILAGIRAMLTAAELNINQIDKVIVAGQFGAHLKPESLTGAGFIPKDLEQKICYAGNTSKSGAYMCLLSHEEREKAEQVVGEVTYLELSTLQGYDKLFVDSLVFEW